MSNQNAFLEEMSRILQEKTLWERLQSETRPIVLYGMGNGAEKIISAAKARGISIRGVFASDAFVRGQTFLGFSVRTLAEIEAELGDFVVLLAFGSSLPEVREQIDRIASKHELYAPDLPLFGDGMWERSYALAHREALGKVYALLADEHSRETFCSLFAYRMSGKLDYLRLCETPREELYRLLRVNGEEDYLDLGAYDGDTVRELLEKTGGAYHSITAVEPDPKNRRKLLEKTELYCPGLITGERFRLIEGGVWRENGELAFDNAAGRNSSLSAGGRFTVPVYSIDHILRGRNCSLIKMDVEGAEAEALLGAKETLFRLKPKLIFSAYHRVEDIFALPLLLETLQPGYRIFLRHQPYYPAWEFNFCARYDDIPG